MAHAEHLVVVSTEHLVVVGRRLQLVAEVDDLLAILGTLGIVGRAGIHLSVQVELGQNHIDHTLAGAILLRIGRQLLSTFLHVLHQPVEEVGTAHLLGIGTTHFRVLVSEGHISEEVDGMQIAQSAQGASLSTILLHQGIVGAGSVDLAHHFVADGNLVEHAAVAGRDEDVARSPLQSVQILDGLVIPANYSLVGGELLQVVEGTQVLAKATVDTRDIRAATIAVGRAHGKCRVALGEELVVCLCACEHIIWRVEVGVDRRHVQVAHTRSEGHGSSKGKAKYSGFLHIEFHILILQIN